MDRGAAGGRETLRRYGREHFREIGRRGFQSFTDRDFQGDRQQAGEWLRTRAHERRLDSFVERELDRRLEAGEKTVCEELTVLAPGANPVVRALSDAELHASPSPPGRGPG